MFSKNSNFDSAVSQVEGLVGNWVFKSKHGISKNYNIDSAVSQVEKPDGCYVLKSKQRIHRFYLILAT